MILTHLKDLILGKVKMSDAKEYIIGHLRHKLYYNKFSSLRSLLPQYIREQIDFRIKVMDKECYNNGQCKICGCETTALQMANKSCDKPCYPVMMSKKQWNFFKRYKFMNDVNGVWYWNITDDSTSTNLMKFNSYEELGAFLHNKMLLKIPDYLKH